MAAAARSRGVAGTDIRTAGMSIHNNHDQRGRRDGFQAWMRLAVTMRDLDAAGAVLAEVVAAGGDAGRILSFGMAAADPRKGRDAAREAAFVDALHQATQLAGLAGRELGPVRRVVARPGHLHAADTVVWQEQSGREAGVPIEAGDSSVTVSLRIWFDLV